MRWELRFLSLDNALRIHDDSIMNDGGMAGVRDLGLLESAIAMPQAMFDGEYLHRGLAAMAAALLYHLCQNHPFIDGNKRVAAFSAVLFLAVNGVPDERLPAEQELEQVTQKVACGAMTKSALTGWFHGLGLDESLRSITAVLPGGIQHGANG